jgi:hypothetical protein
MLKGHLGFYNLALLLFAGPLVCGMKTRYIILHNMIVKDERDEHGGQYEYNFDKMGQYVCNYNAMGERVIVSYNVALELDAFIQNYKNIKNKETHYQLKTDLIEHLWENHPELYNFN